MIPYRIKICVAESVTGGQFSYNIVKYRGASKILEYSLVCYNNKSKFKFLDIKEEIDKYGVVSKQVAELMAKKIIKFSNGPKILALSCTGQAGPELINNKEKVGTVFIGVNYNNNIYSVRKSFKQKNRISIIKLTVNEMINQGLKAIKN